MIQYRFHFLNEESVVLTEAQFAGFIQRLSANPDLQIFIIDDWSRGLQLHNMTYYEAEEVAVTGQDKVVKPPTPAEIREEKAAMSKTTPTDLQHQLEHPDIGKDQ